MIKRVHRQRFISNLFFALLCLFSCQLFVAADERELEGDRREKLDVVLVIDDSGSMLVTDPLKLRYEGAKLFLRFLSPQDRFSIVSFSDSSKIIRPLKPYDPGQLAEASKEIEQIANEGRYTDLYTGLETAKGILRESPREDARQAILLLSDGKMEPPPAVGTGTVRTQQLVESLVPEMKSSGLRLYTMALSDQSDKELLAELASAVDGVHWFAPSAEKLQGSFADLFLAVKKPQVVPLTTRGFSIDEDIDEATFYVNRDENAQILVRSPTGQEISESKTASGISWFKGHNFDVVTITKPEAGDWRIDGVESGEGFATVLTNLKLQSDWPTAIRADEPVVIQARLYDGVKPVSLPEMSGAAQFAFQIVPTDKISAPVIREPLSDSGEKGDKIEKDGIFSASIKLHEPGEYKLTVVVKAPTFQRTQQIPFRVKPQLITLEVGEREAEAPEKANHAEHGAGGHHDAAGHDTAVHDTGVHDAGGHEQAHDTSGHSDTAAGDHHETTHHNSAVKTAKEFRVLLSPESALFKTVDVKLTALNADRKRFILPLTRSTANSQLYTVSAGKLPKYGEYQLKAELIGEGKKKELIKGESKTLTFTLEEDQVIEEVLVIDAEHEKKPAVPKETSPFIYIFLVTLVNLAAGGVSFVLNKKMQSKGVKLELPPELKQDLTKYVAEIELKAQLVEIDYTDLIYIEPEETVVSDEHGREADLAPSAAVEGEAG